MQSFIKNATSRSGGRRKRRDRGHQDEATITQQLSTAASSSTNAEARPSDIFASACASFVDSLREDERAKFVKFDSAQSMLENFQQLACDSPAQKSRLLSCCHKLQRLTSTLGPFFEVVSNLVGSPECAGVVWGALRLISVLGVNYVSFLEKIGGMFEKMAAALSIFEEFSAALRNQATDPTNQGYLRMTQLLAQIYCDLINFCHRACKLFTPSGHFSRAKLHLTIAWTPFNLYFSDLVEKFSSHSKLFRLEMKATSNSQILGFYSDWKRRITRRDEVAEKEIIETNIFVLQKRLRAPGWAANFEHARNHRAAETGHWLLNDSILCQHVDFTGQGLGGGANQQNVLFIRAKPGYGKTTLATLVIDHLKAADTYSRNSHTLHLAFYFFDKQNRDASHSYGAYRALLSQLVHLRRHDEKVIDIASIARPEHDTGQSFASDNEVFDILHLLLLHIGPCVFVLDGVDECADREDLFKGLYRLASDHKANCRIILFSRPSVRLPLQFSKQCEFLNLGVSRNSADLTTYIEPLVHDLLESGELILLNGVTLENVVEKIVSKANGMFLWATLFMEYLRLPILTISGRWKDIEDPSRFEGLYDLYEGIFTALRKNYPTSTQVKVRRALQWVCGAFRPLHIEELRVAIEIEANVVLEHHDMIPNFAQALGPISGALLEVTKDNTVRMIHLTLYDYLITSTPVRSPVSDYIGSSKTFQSQAIHHYASASCLSYLRHNMPSGPYATKTVDSVRSALPTAECRFMEYATKFWISHFFRMYNEMKHAPEMEQCNQVLEDVGASCIAFISDRTKFTSWIEASWRLRLQHQLPKLLGGFLKETFQRKSSDDLPSSETSLMKALSLMRDVWEEQTYLNSSWSKVLEIHPEEIWKPSISAFSRLHQPSSLHQLSDDATMRPLAHHQTTKIKYTVIQSQVSGCGRELAVITVEKPNILTKWSDSAAEADDSFASSVFGTFESREQLVDTRDIYSDDETSPITVSYQIWSLEDVEQLVFEKSVDISRTSMILPLSEEPGQRPISATSFLFPSSITPTLREVVLVDTFLKIFTSDSPTGLEFHAHVQKLDFSWIFWTSMPRPWEIPVRSDVKGSILSMDAGSVTPGLWFVPTRNTHVKFTSFYRLLLSPCGNFLLVLKPGIELTQENSWSIDIFQDLTYHRRPGRPCFQWIASQDALILPHNRYNPYGLLKRTEYPVLDANGNGGVDTQDLFLNFMEGIKKAVSCPSPIDEPTKEISGYQNDVEITFHPTLPQVAYATDATYLWNFGTMNGSEDRVREQPPRCVHAQPLSQMRYSSCGQRIHGFENFERVGASDGVIIDLSQLQSSSTPDIPEPADHETSQMLVLNDTERGVSKCVMPEQRTPSIQTSNTSFIARDANGMPTLSTLQQSSKDNSLTLHTFNTRGQSKQETLLRLPSEIADNGSITLLNPLDHDPNELRIVLEAPKRSYYTFQEQTGNVKLPAMIKRKIESIPTVETLHGGAQQMLLEDQNPDQRAKKRKRDDKEVDVLPLRNRNFS